MALPNAFVYWFYAATGNMRERCYLNTNFVRGGEGERVEAATFGSEINRSGTVYV